MEAGEAVISIKPPQAQFVLQPLVSMGMPLTVAFDPGDQGAVGIGMHGKGIVTGGGGLKGGVAVCAAMIIGLIGELHKPNGTIFRIGIIALMSATGRKFPVQPVIGNAFNTLGARP
jgi:hypothetical protein